MRTTPGTLLRDICRIDALLPEARIRKHKATAEVNELEEARAKAVQALGPAFIALEGTETYIEPKLGTLVYVTRHVNGLSITTVEPNSIDDLEWPAVEQANTVHVFHGGPVKSIEVRDRNFDPPLDLTPRVSCRPSIANVVAGSVIHDTAEVG